MAAMRTTLILTTLAAGALLAACGDAGDTSSGKSSPEEAQLAFAKCMREHGVDMPDPKPAAGGGPSRVEFRARAGEGGPRRFDAAQKACQKYMRAAAPELSPEQEQEIRDSALKFARCMRANGVDMPDPTFEEGGGVLIRIGEPGKGPDPAANPRFRAAQKKCERLMPEPPQGPGEVPAP
jgi:hypothetical protein